MCGFNSGSHDVNMLLWKNNAFLRDKKYAGRLRLPCVCRWAREKKIGNHCSRDCHSPNPRQVLHMQISLATGPYSK